MSHTPGPWIASPKRNELDLLEYSIDYNNENGSGHVATVDASRGERLEANARLIAAAPEMLEALRIALSALSDLVANYPSEAETYNRVESAIAKADGRE